MNSLEFYSHGKLLLSGEYLVLQGAQALALPLTLGQKMRVEMQPNSSFYFVWESYYQNACWFHATFNRQTLTIENSNDYDKAEFIKQLLIKAEHLNPGSVIDSSVIKITTTLEFHPNWGLGSSSSLIANIASWTQTNPYTLLQLTLGGSGYDIACANASGPIVYALNDGIPLVTPLTYKPKFHNNLFFIYLGKKISSFESISKFKQISNSYCNEIQRINELTQQIIQAQTLMEFENGINMHEEIISTILNTVPIKAQLFTDFEGSIKSLGAWGGDFILVTSKQEKKSVQNYFKNKGLSTLFSFNEIVLKSKN